MQSSSSTTKQHQSLANAIKEKLKTNEVLIQRQAIYGLLNEIKTPQIQHSMIDDIVHLLLSYIKNNNTLQNNRTIITCAIDVLVQICTNLDFKQYPQIKEISCNFIIDELIKFSLQIHPTFISYLTRAILDIYLTKFIVKENFNPLVLINLNLSKNNLQNNLVILIQNRSECLIEILNQMSNIFIKRNDLNLTKLFKFFSPFFTHIFSNRNLLNESVTINYTNNTHIPSGDGLTSDLNNNDNVYNNIKGGTILKTNIMSSSEIKLKYLIELKNIILFKFKNKEFKQGYNILIYLLHFIPTFEVNLNVDIVTSCLLPLKIIFEIITIIKFNYLNDLQNLNYDLQNKNYKIGNIYQQISLMIGMIFKHLFSIYLEIIYLGIDINIFLNYFFEIFCNENENYLIEYIPLICHFIVNSETQVEIINWLNLLQKLIFYLILNFKQYFTFYKFNKFYLKSYNFKDNDIKINLFTNLIYCLPIFLYLISSSSSSEEMKEISSLCIQKIEKFISESNWREINYLEDEEQEALEEDELEEDEEEQEEDNNENIGDIEEEDYIYNKMMELIPLFERYEIGMLFPSHYQLINKFFKEEVENKPKDEEQEENNFNIKLNVKYCEKYIDSMIQLLPKERENNNSSISSSIYLCCMISLLFLLSSERFSSLSSNTEDKEETISFRKKCISSIDKLCSEIITLRGGIILQPLIFYELPKEKNSSIQLSLIHLLPKLGTKHSVCVTPIVKLLTNLMNSSKDLAPIAIICFTQLWKQNEKFFTKLKNILFSFSKYIQTGTSGDNYNLQTIQITNYNHLNNFDIEIRIALAKSCLEICNLKIEKGVELLPLLTRMLCQDNDPLVLSYSLKAMTILCKHYIVDFFTIWYKVIQRNVLHQSEIHTIVLREVCCFFECSVEEISYENLSELQRKSKEEEEYNLFVDYDSVHKHQVREVIEILLENTNHKDETVRKACFETLGKYPLHTLLYAMKSEEESDEEEEASEKKAIGADVLEQREENIFAKQEIRRGWLLNLCSILIERISKEKSQSVLDAMSPMIQKILKAELRKPKNISLIASKDKKASSESIGTISFEKFDLLSEFIVKQYESKKNVQVTANAVLWQGNLTKVKSPIPEVEAFKRLLNDLSTDIVTGNSPEDYYLQFIISQGFFTFADDYYYCAVESFKQAFRSNNEVSQSQTTQLRESQTHFDDAFEVVFNNLKNCIEQSTVPSATSNYILTMAGLCLSLPINAHHHVIRIIDLIKQKLLNNTTNESQQENIRFACNMVLASASFELHIFSQLKDICFILLNQLNDLISDQQTNLDISSASSAIALGVIVKNLCLSSLENNYEEGKQLVKLIANYLYCICFKTNDLLFTTIDYNNENNNEYNNEYNNNLLNNLKDIKITQLNLNWKQKANILIGLSHTIDTLLRINLVNEAKEIFNKIMEELDQIDQFIQDPTNFTKDDLNLIELNASIGMILSQIILSFYHFNELTFDEVIDYIEVYKNLIESLKDKTLSIYLKLNMYILSGFGTLLFGVLCETMRKESFDNFNLILDNYYNLHLEEYLQKIKNFTNESASYQIGCLVCLSTLLGIDLFTPINKLKFEDSDIFGLQSTEKKPLSITTYRSIFFNQILLQNKNLQNLINQSVDLLKITSTEPQIPIKVRKYSSLFIGEFSNLYKTQDNLDEISSDRLPIKFLSENGLAFYFIQKLTNVVNNNLQEQDNNTAIFYTALSNLLLAEKLPKITWSKVIQLIFRKSLLQQVDENNTLNLSLQKVCLHFLCKDAQSTTSSSNSISTLSTLCEMSNFLALNFKIQFEISNLFPKLIGIFPPSRTCLFIDDLIKMTFKNLNEDILFNLISKCLDCEVKSNLFNVMKYLENYSLQFIELNITKRIKRNYLFELQFKENINLNEKDEYNVKINVKINYSILKMIEKLANCFIKNNFTNHSLLHYQSLDYYLNNLNIDNNNLNNNLNIHEILTNLILRLNVSKLNNDLSTLKLVRQLAVKGILSFFGNNIVKEKEEELNNVISSLLSQMISEILNNLQNNLQNVKKKFIQDSIDMLSFIINDLETVYFNYSLLQKSSQTNLTPLQSLQNLYRALFFLSNLSLLLGANDIYAIYNAHDSIFINNNLNNNNIEINTTHKLKFLIYGLIISFKNNQLDNSTEQSLMSRMYSLLTNYLMYSTNHSSNSSNKKKNVGSGVTGLSYRKVVLEKLLFEFTIPFILQIKKLREDQHVSFNQIGSLLEYHAMKMIGK
ncbi:hypothetical protein ABK040_005226 [Willaertia magna]